MDTEIRIFAGSSGRTFAEAMCQYLKVGLGESETLVFSEGNLFVRIAENVRNEDVFVVQPIGLDPNREFTEILFWMDAFKRASAGSVTAIVPYFGYAKGDKKDEPRVSIRARVCAECIELAGADRMITMDLHSPQIQGFFKKPVDHLSAIPLLCECARRLGMADWIVVSPDAGFAKRARQYASCLGTDIAICDKIRRTHDEKAEVLDVIGPVAGRNALIVDDLVLTGRTLADAARALRLRGARRIVACATHLLISLEHMQLIKESGIERLIGTDSVIAPGFRHGMLTLVSVAPLFAEAVRRVHFRDSISTLFTEPPVAVFAKALEARSES